MVISGQDWTSRSYGRISGGQIEKCLSVFREIWAECESWSETLSDEAAWARALEKIVCVPSWVNFYQDDFVELLAKVIAVAGFTDQLSAAVRSRDPIGSMLEMTSDIAGEAPDHPASMPLAFATLGNLQAIARYSRSINDMIVACREKGDIQSLLNAVSIDAYIVSMPFFMAGMRLGQLNRDQSFAEATFKAIVGPHGHRLEYAELRWVEYLLRDQGAFDACSREDIYELCVVHLGVYDPSGSKKDPKAALFARFRAWQKEAGIQNPRFGFSAKHQ